MPPCWRFEANFDHQVKAVFIIEIRRLDCEAGDQVSAPEKKMGAKAENTRKAFTHILIKRQRRRLYIGIFFRLLFHIIQDTLMSMTPVSEVFMALYRHVEARALVSSNNVVLSASICSNW